MQGKLLVVGLALPSILFFVSAALGLHFAYSIDAEFASLYTDAALGKTAWISVGSGGASAAALSLCVFAATRRFLSNGRGLLGAFARWSGCALLVCMLGPFLLALTLGGDGAYRDRLLVTIMVALAFPVWLWTLPLCGLLGMFLHRARGRAVAGEERAAASAASS